ncbi:MAG: hypothetical protein ACRDBP_09760 [Luteolibacter sp.]
MSTRRFVSGSSILLAGWLGATFLNEVPSQRYPKLDKTPPTAATPVSEDETALASATDSH